MNKEEFIENCKKLNINLSSSQIEKFDRYKELLQQWNEKFNLTRIIDDNEIYLKHFYDSLCLIKSNLLNGNLKLCDFGTGAGFPGIVLKIAFPYLDITLVESNTKKCLFLKEVIKELNLKEINVINERIEIFSKNNVERFDIVTCRAVSSLRILCEICSQMLKINGYFIPLKSSVSTEMNEAKKTIKKLNLKLINIIEYNLPIENSYRSIPIIGKVNHTDKKYPREYNKILKKPLE